MNKTKILAGLGMIAAALFAYSFFIEANEISVSTVPIVDNGLAAALGGKKVVQISDLHITSIGLLESRLIEKLNEIRPDLLFITGDFTTDGKDEEACLEVLRRIDMPECGIWAVLGNTDRYKANGIPNKRVRGFIAKLRGLGIKVLEDRGEFLKAGGGNGLLMVIGVEEDYLFRSKLDWLLEKAPGGVPVILLSHFPSILQEQTDALTINLGEDDRDEVYSWAWQDHAYSEHDTGIVRFEKRGRHRLRVQSREDGVSIDEICLVRETGASRASGPPEIGNGLPPGDGPSAISPVGVIAVRAADVDRARVFGAWKKIQDPTASSGAALRDVPGLGSKKESPFVNPKDYFEADFEAEGGQDYHVWARMKADEKDPGSTDSVYLQFSDALSPNGEPAYRIGELAVRHGLTRINLILAGHNHGGQVRIPLVGAISIVPHHRIFFDQGLFESQGTKLYVNRGIGTALLPVRFLCPPEITVFRFLKKGAEPQPRGRQS